MSNTVLAKKVAPEKIKLTKCSECNTETYQRDGICVLCKTGINQMYRELIELLRKEKQLKLIKKLKLVEAK